MPKTSTGYSDFDYERRHADVQRLERAVSHFNQAAVRGMSAIKEISSALEAVSAVLCEMTAVTASASPFSSTGKRPPTSAWATLESEMQADSVSQVGAASESVASHLKDDRATKMHNIAVAFADEVREINEGIPLRLYNTGVHRDVVNRLLPVMEHLRVVGGIAKKRDETLERYQKYKKVVDKEEKKYAKKGKPFVDQASHKKYAAKRDVSWKEYTTVRTQFFESYETLMEVNGHVAAHLVHRYLSLNGEYLRNVLDAVERVLSTMEAIYPLNAEFGSLAPSIVAASVAHGLKITHTKAAARPCSSSGSRSSSASRSAGAARVDSVHSAADTAGTSQDPARQRIATAPDSVRPVKTLEDYAHVINQWQRLEVDRAGTDRGEPPMPGAAEEEENKGGGGGGGGGRGGKCGILTSALVLCSTETAPARGGRHCVAKDRDDVEVASAHDDVRSEASGLYHVWRPHEAESEGGGRTGGNQLFYDPTYLRGAR